MPWKKLLAWATGQIDEALHQKLEFVLEENRVYRALLDRHSPHSEFVVIREIRVNPLFACLVYFAVHLICVTTSLTCFLSPRRGHTVSRLLFAG
jgi:hypothetical protein